jgi:putative endonuclease
LVEHHNGIVGVRGSNPLGSTSLRRSKAQAKGCLAEAAGVGGLAQTCKRPATARQAILNVMQQFWHVYILESLEAKHFYVGMTEDLKSRVAKHNAREVSHTSKFKPWRIKTAVAFTDPKRATAFESYLKSGSGRAFAKRHF